MWKEAVVAYLKKRSQHLVRFQVLAAPCMKISSGTLRRVVWLFADVSGVLVASHHQGDE
jgi:hypothetical protein